ncbi:MAG: glycosyltransferase family 2 protein [Chryseolinea sp.]
MSKDNLVSVIIPTYNRVHFLTEAVQSVLSQTWNALEVIIVDDGSTDDTRKVVGAFKDSRVKYFYRKHTGSIGNVREFGIDQAKGDFLSFLDSDDYWLPTKLEIQMKLLALYPQASFCLTHGEQFGEGAISPPSMEHLFVGNMMKAQLIEERFVVYLTTLLFKKAAIEKKSAMDSVIPSGDAFFFFKLASMTDGIFTGEILTRIRKHEKNTSSAREFALCLEHIDMLGKLKQLKLLNDYEFNLVASKQYYKLGLLYRKRLRRKEAINTFGTYIKMNPFKYKGYVRLCQSLF